MGDYWLAYVLIAVIGFILLGCFLKMHEYLKQMNEKMDTIISEMKNTSKTVSDKAEKIDDHLINVNRKLSSIESKEK